MTDIGIEGELVPLRQGDRVAKGQDVSIVNTVSHRNFPNADDLQQLYDDLDGVNIIPSAGRSPYKYFQKLQLGSGIAQFPSGNIALNSGNNFKTTHVLVPEINTTGGIVPDVPFFSEYYGSLRVEVTTAVTLRITARFYHFSNQPNEFSNIQSVEDRFSENRQTPVRLRGLSSPPIILSLGTLNIPSGPTFNVTEEFLNTVFPFRIELEIESFDTATGETPTATTITELELVEPTIIFSQIDKTVLSTSDIGIAFSAIRFNDENNNNLPVIDGTTQQTFNDSLDVSTIKEGYAFRFATGTIPAEGVTYTLGRFLPFDTLVSKVDNPSLNIAGDWNVLRAGTDYPVSATESHYVDQVTESDVVTDKADASSPSEATFVRFWIRAVQVTTGTVNNPGTGLLDNEAQTSSFTQSTTDDAKILYVAIDTTYGTAQGAANLRARVESADGEILQRLPFSTAFTRDADISTAKSAEVYRTTAALRGEFLGYLANQVVKVFRTETQRHFKISAQPIVDNTQNVNDLPETSLAEDVQGKLNKPTLLVKEQGILDAITVSGSTESSDTTLPINVDMLRKFGGFSAKESDYDTVQTDTGIFASFQGTSTQIVAIDDAYQITSFTGSVSGTSLSIVELIPSLLKGKRMYRVTLPNETSASNRYIPNGIVTSGVQYDVDSSIKIGGENLDQELHDQVYAGGNNVPQLSEPMQAFQSHLTKSDVSVSSWTVPDNPVSVRSTITRVFAAYFDENRRGSAPFTGNYFEDLADPTITLTAGLDVSGAPLTNDFKKVVAFTHYIVDGNFTTDVNLLQAGTRRILGIDANGLYLQQGDGAGSAVSVSFNQRLFAGATGGGNSIQYLTGTGATSVSYFVPSTPTFPLALTIRFKTVEANGTVGPETQLAYTVTDRAVSQSQTSQVVAISLPTPPGGTRNETITTEYNATTNQVIIGTTGLSQNTTQDVTHLGMEVTFADSLLVNSSNGNRKVRFGEQDEHRQTEVSIVFILEATSANITDADPPLQIVAVINGRQENVLELNYRETNFDFSNLIFGPTTAMTNYFYSADDKDGADNVLFPGKQSYISDGSVSISQVQVYDFDTGGNPLNTPTHAELYQMWLHRDRFLGLFNHPNFGSRKFFLDGDLGLRNIAINSTTITADIVVDAGTTDGYRWEFK